MKRAVIFCLALLPLLACAQKKTYAQEDKGMTGYLFAHLNFYGEYFDGEHTSFALSRDGETWNDIMNGQPVYPTYAFSHDNAQRDAYICRMHDGNFMLAATDMLCRLGWDHNHILNVMTGPDLVNWTRHIQIDLRSPENLKALGLSRPEDLKAAWAPEVIYDPQTKSYVLYYSVGFPTEHRIYYSLLDAKLNVLTPPRPFFYPGHDVIDADIVWNDLDQNYMMVYKDEREGQKNLHIATAKYLVPKEGDTGRMQWTLIDDSEFNIPNAFEAPTLWRPIGSKRWRLSYFGRQNRFYTCDLDEHGLHPTNARVMQGRVAAQHGSVLKLTRKEYERLERLTTPMAVRQGSMSSPNGRISGQWQGDALNILYEGHYAFTLNHVKGLKPVGKEKKIVDDYTMITGKRKLCHNEAYEYTFEQSTDTLLRLRFYNDGVAYQYEYRNLKGATPGAEPASYTFRELRDCWLQDYRAECEGFYNHHDEIAKTGAHYGYPALFSNDFCKVLLTEGGVEPIHGAASLWTVGKNTLQVRADKNEKKTDGTWQTPWRLAIMGRWSDIVESTLVTDVSKPCALPDTSWIKPGMTSWVYWAYNHGTKDYPTIKRYVDMAADMHLPYTLIDWEWDQMDNGGNIDDLLSYCKQRGVKATMWFNSDDGWARTGAPSPHFELFKAENRERVFSKLADKGIAGVKVDFFDGQGQSTISYFYDLLRSASEHHLMVNLHGATVPRGWQRTYPNLVSTEGVLGEEWYNNGPQLTKLAPWHNCVLPFTRNVVGPMDYTPCAFTNSQYPHITTDTHELALLVAFESSMQHLADRPESFASKSEAIRSLISTLPTTWDETRLLGGKPGEWVAIARKKGNDWYVAVLNGTDNWLQVRPNFYLIDHADYDITSYGEGMEALPDELLQMIKTTTSGRAVDNPGKESIKLKAWGGALLKLKRTNL